MSTNPASAMFLTEINAAVNLTPAVPGYLASLFPVRGIATGFVQIDTRTEDAAILPILSRYASSPNAGSISASRQYKTIEVPKIPISEFVSPVDVDGVRTFGSQAAQAMQSLLDDKMRAARANLDRTLEFMRAKAMQGIVVDHLGNPLADLYSLMGAVKVTVDFTLGTAGTNVLQKCLDVCRSIEDGLLGDTSNGFEVIVSPEFFDKFVAHPNVKDAYKGYSEAANRLGGDMRKGFTFGGLTFVEYRTSINGTRLLDASHGVAFPRGTSNTFNTFVAPAVLNNTVGKLGQLVNMLPVREADNGEGYHMIGQSCPLPLCLRPMALIDVFTSN